MILGNLEKRVILIMNDTPMLFNKILSKFLEQYALLYNIGYMTLRSNLYRTLRKLCRKGIISNNNAKYYREFSLTSKGILVKKELLEDIKRRTIFYNVSKSIPEKLSKPYTNGGELIG